MDEDLKKTVLDTVDKLDNKMDELRVADSLDLILDLFSRCNKYIDETRPWVLAKDPDQIGRLATVLYNLLASVRIGAILLKPYLPDTADKILKSLNTANTDYDTVHDFDALETGITITDQPEILFARLNPAEVMAKVKEQQKNQAEAKKKEAEKLPQIDIKEFQKMDLRVGRVLSCERHPDADKLFVLQVDIGEGKPRQIVSGLAESYTPGQMIGKSIVVVANLKPAVLRGQKSEGMLLAGRNGREIQVVEAEGLLPGTKIS